MVLQTLVPDQATLIAFVSNGPQPDILLLSVPGLRQDRNQPLSSTQKYQHIRYTFHSFASQGRSQELRVSSQSDQPCHALLRRVLVSECQEFSCWGVSGVGWDTRVSVIYSLSPDFPPFFFF